MTKSKTGAKMGRPKGSAEDLGKPFSARLPVALAAAVDEAAEEEGIGRGEMLREIVRDWYARRMKAKR
jgi:metal-responsive CopG/Arc/MetJ family transcriptional regulator